MRAGEILRLAVGVMRVTEELGFWADCVGETAISGSSGVAFKLSQHSLETVRRFSLAPL